MALRVGINGLGRIGKGIVSAWIKSGLADIDIVMINDKTEAKHFAHLLKYDSVHGVLDADLRPDGDRYLVVNHEKRIALSSERDLEKTPWHEQKVDVVLECTGNFNTREDASVHFSQGVKKVITSAPCKNPDMTIVMGVNDHLYNPDTHHLISNASCTTNCLAPVAKVLNDSFGIEYGVMTTIHSYTNDQKILDKYHKDIRRARAGALSMIPTTTGAAKAIGLVIPELAGKLDGLAIRVPTPNVSMVDLVVTLSKKTDIASINEAYRAAEKGPLRGLLSCSEEPLVSIDFNGRSESAIVDTELTNVLGGNMAKILAWYDNETGFSYRMLDLVLLVGKNMSV